MKTKLQKIKDIDFKLTFGAICLAGIFLIILMSVNLYTANVCYWPLYVVLAIAAIMVIWKLTFQVLIVKYESHE